MAELMVFDVQEVVVVLPSFRKDGMRSVTWVLIKAYRTRAVSQLGVKARRELTVNQDEHVEDSQFFKIHRPKPINIHAEPHLMSLSKPQPPPVPDLLRGGLDSDPERTDWTIERRDGRQNVYPSNVFQFSPQSLCTPDQKRQLLQAATWLPDLAQAGLQASACFGATAELSDFD